jgi:hypothetical protein
MEKGVVKLVIFNGEDFSYWKNQTRNYLLSHGHAIWKIVQEAYVIPAMLNNVTQGEVQRYENNYKALNLITTALGKNVYDRVSHLETAHNVWLKLCNTYEGSTRLFLRNLVNRLMIVLLGLSPSSAAYVLMVLLHTLIMNVLSSCYMHLMTMYGA